MLLSDVVPLHFADEVLEELRLQGLWFLVVPARLTWMLQPLDTHCFAKDKRHLQNCSRTPWKRRLRIP